MDGGRWEGKGGEQRTHAWPAAPKAVAQRPLSVDYCPATAMIAETPTISSRARGIAIWQLLNFCRTQPSGKGLPIKRLLDRVRRLVRLADDRDLRQVRGPQVF